VPAGRPALLVRCSCVFVRPQRGKRAGLFEPLLPAMAVQTASELLLSVTLEIPLVAEGIDISGKLFNIFIGAVFVLSDYPH